MRAEATRAHQAHSDPRTGETTYSLANITRGGPAAGLFDVPSDYTIRESSYLRRLSVPR